MNGLDNNVKDEVRYSFKGKDLSSITPRDFVEFLKVKEVIDKGHSLENLKNMFGGSNGKLITISLNGGDPITYESITKASKETGIPIKKLYRCN